MATAFANGFHGDDASLGYILKTLERKSYLIPGIITNPSISVNVDGSDAYYFTRGASNVGDGSATVGSKLDYTSTGVTRKTIPLNKAIQIKDVLPLVNVSSVSADVVGDRVIYNSLIAANEFDTLGVAKITSGTTGTDYTAVTGNVALTTANVYQEILNARKQFLLGNKAKGMKPTGMLVGPTAEALILQNTAFVRSTPVGDAAVQDAVIGKIGGMQVVSCPDLDETVCPFLLINAEGFAAVTNVRSLSVTAADAAGYPNGTLIGGEIGYGFEIADKSLIYVYPTAA